MDWFGAHVPVWPVCVWCLCTVLSVVRATCPDNAVQKAMKCTAGLGLGPPTSPSSNALFDRGQIELVKKACRNKTFTKAFNCMEEITQACQGNSDQEHFLRNMIDVRKTSDAVTFFCSHLSEYEEYAPCIRRMHSTLIRCVHQQRKTMETKVKASNNMDFLMPSSCKYLNAAEICTDRVLSESCGSSAASMVKRVFTAFKPPVCLSGQYASQDAQNDDTFHDTATGAAARSISQEMTWLWLVLVMNCLMVGRTDLFHSL